MGCNFETIRSCLLDVSLEHHFSVVVYSTPFERTLSDKLHLLSFCRRFTEAVEMILEDDRDLLGNCLENFLWRNN